MISKKTKLFVSALAFFNVLCSPMVLASFNGNDHPESDESFGARASELQRRIKEDNEKSNDCLGCLIDAATDWVCEKLHVRRRLRVRNDNTEDLTIYLLVEDQPIELGTVGAESIQTFRLPRDLNYDLYRVGGYFNNNEDYFNNNIDNFDFGYGGGWEGHDSQGLAFLDRDSCVQHHQNNAGQTGSNTGGLIGAAIGGAIGGARIGGLWGAGIGAIVGGFAGMGVGGQVGQNVNNAGSHCPG